MQQKAPYKYFILLIIILFNVGCDQVSKIVVRKHINDYENIAIVKDRFTLTKVENTGAFLSAGANLSDNIRLIFLTILPIFVLGYGFYYLAVEHNLQRGFQVGMCCLLGGGIGNIYDRIVHGSVTDFLHLDFVLFRTGVFNIADMSIMTGITIMVWYTFLKKQDEIAVDK